MCTSQGVGRTPAAKHTDIIMEIISEFVFCEIDRRGGRKRKLNCIQELQLLEVLCDYFTYTGNNSDSVRNIVFMSLFPPTHSERSRLLIKLVSLAISTKNIPVLTATGIWMQQLGCTSKFSLDLAQGLVKDYFVLIPKAVGGLQDLPQLAPQFTANFLTAVAEMYGIVESPLYSRLHLALLQSLLECYSPLPGHHHSTTTNRETISAQHLAAITEPILKWFKDLSRIDNSATRSRAEIALQLSLDRYAQVIQVGL
ncbi:hypothetical protein C0J52_13887 [Blattella germanica]|nr:hypothetical protein C0J52_13887 [Blattella germanica]